MTYRQIAEGRFLSRPNRFIAMVETAQGVRRAHVKNTGRCRELLLPGATVWLECHPPDTGRKTDYSLIAVQRGERLINMDSQAPNQVAWEAVASGALLLPGYRSAPVLLRREVTHGDSRVDLFAGGGGPETFLEVKGVTLEEDGAALFPDAPTERGIKHLRGLARAVGEGYGACVLFVIQMAGVDYFAPNVCTHPAFAVELALAREAGVLLLARDCLVAPNELVLGAEVPIRLEPERSLL